MKYTLPSITICFAENGLFVTADGRYHVFTTSAEVLKFVEKNQKEYRDHILEEIAKKRGEQLNRDQGIDPSYDSFRRGRE